MTEVERELDRILQVLRAKIRQQGFTQSEIRERLDWDRSYLSQLLTKQKTLRVYHLLCILSVLGIEVSEFFTELYPAKA